MPAKQVLDLENVVIKFAGDSGDGMQLTGGQFTNNTALIGNDIATFPDFPAEIRAPIGTLAGVSGFQLHFSSNEIYTPGDHCDVLVAMNAAALKANIGHIKKGGIIIANTAGFDSRNLKLSKQEENPLENGSLDNYKVHSFDITKLTRECLADTDLGMKIRDRSKNMFVLGFVYYMYNRSLDSTIAALTDKFSKKPEVLDANIKVLKAGYNFADTTETFSSTYNVAPAKLESGTYRSIMGNHATVLGLVAAGQKSGLPLFFATYPITPASDILHGLAQHKNFGVMTFQCEDEIAAMCTTIGAAFGGHLAVTATSGPGIALKGEAMGLGVMLELPMVIVNVQRAGPSTGMPTKTEQADLLQALYGRNGECPMPVIAASSPADCFNAAFEACRIALEHMIPVTVLSDGYIGNGAEPWKFPSSADLPDIKVQFVEPNENGAEFHPYVRDENLVRPWAVPGTKGREHRLGGLEKDSITGNVSYDPENHEKMVKLREQKVANIAKHIPKQAIEIGPEEGDLLVLGWGSTFGSIKSAVKQLLAEGYSVSHAHLRYIKPFPENLDAMLGRFKQVLVPEINNGQLVKVIRDEFFVDAIPYNKIQGVPITSLELQQKIKELLD